MEMEDFKRLVDRLERESVVAPRLYRAKVAALTLLGFLILALIVGLMGSSLLLVAGLLIAAMLSGGWLLVLMLKLGKLLFLLAIPMWFSVKSTVRALFVRLPVPQGHALERADAPGLFAALDEMRRAMRGPRFHRVLIVDDVNAAVVQRPAFGLVGWPRNYLLLGLPLLESMPAPEALAVVAHEYGHLAGAHGHFSAFIYRLRHTWGTLQAHTDRIEGWLGRLLAPLLRWYAPYFNAYTFVLARAEEYQADAAAARLVGADHAAHALKRANIVAPRHRQFIARTFDRVAAEAAPPPDLMCRWAAEAGQAPAEADGRRWLVEALDREGHFMDTHPTLRARLSALSLPSDAMQEPPPALAEASAAERWLGSALDSVRSTCQARWTEQVRQPWATRHAEACDERARLTALRALAAPTVEQRIEALRLTRNVEPDTDLRDALANFNAAHDGHVLGLLLEGVVRIEKNERDGLDLLERAMALDPQATKPACEHARAFLLAQNDADGAERYAERWRQRDTLENERSRQIATPTTREKLLPHGLDDPAHAALAARIHGDAAKHVAAAYIARRRIAADPDAVQFLVGIEFDAWGRYGRKQREVLQRIAALDWPIPIVFVSLDDEFAPLRGALRVLPGARLV